MLPAAFVLPGSARWRVQVAAKLRSVARASNIKGFLAGGQLVSLPSVSVGRAYGDSFEKVLWYGFPRIGNGRWLLVWRRHRLTAAPSITRRSNRRGEPAMEFCSSWPHDWNCCSSSGSWSGVGPGFAYWRPVALALNGCSEMVFLAVRNWSEEVSCRVHSSRLEGEDLSPHSWSLEVSGEGIEIIVRRGLGRAFDL